MPAGALCSCAGRACAPAGHPGGLGTKRHTEHLEQRPARRIDPEVTLRVDCRPGWWNFHKHLLLPDFRGVPGQRYRNVRGQPPQEGCAAGRRRSSSRCSTSMPRSENLCPQRGHQKTRRGSSGRFGGGRCDFRTRLIARLCVLGIGSPVWIAAKAGYIRDPGYRPRVCGCATQMLPVPADRAPDFPGPVYRASKFAAPVGA